MFLNKFNKIVFTPTDFPEPVVPAISKWGSCCKLIFDACPEISLPTQNSREVSSFCLNSFIIEYKDTICLFGFGISIPIVDLPSITSTTLTLLTARDLARSFAIFETWLAFVPGARLISNLVITGPGKLFSTLPSIPNSRSLIVRFSDKSFRYSSVTSVDISSFWSSKSIKSSLWTGFSTTFFFTSLGLALIDFDGVGSGEVSIGSSLTSGTAVSSLSLLLGDKNDLSALTISEKTKYWTNKKNINEIVPSHIFGRKSDIDSIRFKPALPPLFISK